MLKFTKKGFTKDSIEAILLTVFGISPSNSVPTSRKTDGWKYSRNVANPGKIDAHVAKNETAAAASTTGHSNIIFWLYGECVLPKVVMNTDLSPLAIALKVLWVLNKIKAEIKISGSADDNNDTDCESEYAPYFFKAFCPGLGTNKLRDIPFIYMLVNCTEELILNQNLTEMALMQHSASMM